jgi:D-hydroxyproline dehydrogenase subunit alpha
VTQPYDLLIAGGGPAGLAAAAEAAGAGLRTVLVDERVTLGGQIYKRMGPGFVVVDPAALGPDYARGQALIDRVTSSGAEILLSTSVLALEGDHVVVVTEGEPARELTARRRLLAPGAHDRPVAFSGWTLPGVLTAGGAQTLVKTQGVIPGDRILFAGSGPLALAFPAQLVGYGAHVTGVIDAGPAPRAADVVRLLGAAPGNVDLLRDAVRYRAGLLRARVPVRYRRIVVRVEGDGRVESVTHAAIDADWRIVTGTEETVDADTVCLGYGFTPSFELLRMAGCALGDDESRGGPVAILDEWMRTTVPGVSAAGDGTGVDGSRVAVEGGRLAAIGAALDLGALHLAAARAAAAPARARLRRARRFAGALAPMHRVGPGIFELATSDTIVCRCEQVSARRLHEAIDHTADVNVVKSLTRAGMGLCQGRNCQRQVAAMLSARHGVPIAEVALATPRLPARPVALAAIARATNDDPARFQ